MLRTSFQTTYNDTEHKQEELSHAATPIQYVKGIGPRRAEAFAHEGIYTTADIVRFYPRAYIDRTNVPSLHDLKMALAHKHQRNAFSEHANTPFQEVTVIVHVRSVRDKTFGKNRKMLIVSIDDYSNTPAEIIFWNRTSYFRRLFDPNQVLAISGVPELNYGKIQFHHPEIEHIDAEDIELYRSGTILPKYRLTQKMKDAGITMRIMRNVIASALEQELAHVCETLPEYLRAKFDFPPLHDTIRQLHFPESRTALERARKRMKFEELFFFELLLATRHHGIKSFDTAPALGGTSPLARTLVEHLPFDLTRAQKRVLREIINDMRSQHPMNRLLQGDVGSGKTIVALLAMLAAVDAGLQCVLMAPTEILAEQHYSTLRAYIDILNAHLSATGQPRSVDVVQLVGGQNKRYRNEVLDKISSGEAHIIVGTHALFQSAVQYNRLGFVVIDEQHRFGVLQRAELKHKATASFYRNDSSSSTLLSHHTLSPHILVMSATPIPRTLSMTIYGDLDVSTIDELPSNRKPIITKIVFESKLPQIFQFIREQIAHGHQAYIVYPLIEQSDRVEAKSAVQHFEYLQRQIFPDIKLGLLHGQMLWYEKEDAMRAFKDKAFDILVATTVVEVGIDVPNATIMLIENAERFGLAQLHQLRGRVGRSSEQSYCFLATKDHFQFHLYARERQETIRERMACITRLKTMQETTDGFVIAEVDLQLRGPGDVLGTRQSGIPNFTFANILTDADIMSVARQEAFALIADDPHLRKPEHATIRAEFIRQHQGEYTLLSIA